MRVILKYLTIACILNCLVSTAFSQSRAKFNFSFRAGAGSNISTRHFFTNDVEYNVPTTSFVHFGISSNILERNSKSLFLGLELQGVDYYPTDAVRSNLAYFSLLAGKTRKYSLNQWIYLKQTNGISLNTLSEFTSSNVTSNPDFLEYTGGPFKNLNLGVFSNLQVLFVGTKKKNKNLDYGLGFDGAYKGFQLYRNKKYPSYLIKNPFLQYGININMNYNF